jgi:hypothetical protein
MLSLLRHEAVARRTASARRGIWGGLWSLPELPAGDAADLQIA